MSELRECPKMRFNEIDFSPSGRTPEGYKLVEAYVKDNVIVVPINEIPEGAEDIHNCDWEGCGSFDHVVRFSVEEKYHRPTESRLRDKVSKLKHELEMADEVQESYDFLISMLNKRFPVREDGSMPDYKVEDVLAENDTLRERVRELLKSYQSVTDKLQTAEKNLSEESTQLRKVEGLYRESCQRVTELEGEVERLRGALKPFAQFACEIEGAETVQSMKNHCHNCRARACLTAAQEGE